MRVSAAPPVRPPGRLSAEERKASIIQAVRHLFANKGFKGTTTRELAEAAGVSEALLYRYFPTKEALFEAIQKSFCDERVRARFDRLSALAPSTQTLVLLVHFLATRNLAHADDSEERALRNRLMLRSMCEDGDFARSSLQPFANIVVPKVEQCLRAAAATADLEPKPLRPNLGGWFVLNLLMMSSLQLVPTPPVVDFGLSRQELIAQAVWFALRGLGVREEVIRRHYNPEALSALGG